MSESRGSNLTLRERRAMERAQRKAAFQLQRYAPTVVREAIISKNYDAAMAGITKAIEAHEPWALTAWLQVAGALGNQSLNVQITNYVHQHLGMDVDTAKRYVERGRDADQVADDPETVRDAAVRTLKSLFERFPEWRANVLLALGSGAEEA